MTILFSALWVGLTTFGLPLDTKPAFNAALLPAKAARTAAFIPTGWLLERQISGDLDGDQRPDPVLMLIERPSPTAPEAQRERALVVLLADNTGQLRRVAASGTVLYCTGCHGSASDASGTPQLTIKNGTLAIRHVAGTTETLELTQRFRYEPAAGRMRLIGEDQTRNERGTVKTTLKRTDYLTGQQQTERIYPDPNDKSGTRQLTSRTETKVPTTPRYLEDVRASEAAQ
jgi:hypothetical protein